MLQFEFELTGGHGEFLVIAHRTQPGPIEVITTSFRFQRNFPQVVVDRRDRRGMCLKPDQLRMVFVTPGCTPQHCARQKSLTP